jgi:hypothetical protein
MAVAAEVIPLIEDPCRLQCQHWRKGSGSAVRILFDGRKQPVTLHLSYIEMQRAWGFGPASEELRAQIEAHRHHGDRRQAPRRNGMPHALDRAVAYCLSVKYPSMVSQACSVASNVLKGDPITLTAPLLS